jgi:hypothetical protein
MREVPTLLDAGASLQGAYHGKGRVRMAHQWKVIKCNTETLENALNQLDQDGYSINTVLSAGQTTTLALFVVIAQKER